ncbi:MAG: DUF5683 domain-containing protein [Crocinitomicaceae bacterium]
MIKGLALLFCILTFSCFSQEDSLQVDAKQKSFIKDSVKHHSIRTALILSAALPGAGQVYNHIAMPKGQRKAYWKVPLIYSGLATTTYFLISNQQAQSALKIEYKLRLDDLPGDPKWSSYDDQGVLTLYEQHSRWRDLSIVGVALVYLLQLADAGVEAHFVTFDVSPDLTLSVDPVVLNQRSVGVGLTLRIK